MPPEVAELLDVRRVAQQHLELVVQRTLRPRVVLPSAQRVENVLGGVVPEGSRDEAAALLGEAVGAPPVGGLRVGVEDLGDRVTSRVPPGRGGRGG
jgi:hypothetical protein